MIAEQKIGTIAQNVGSHPFLTAQPNGLNQLLRGVRHAEQGGRAANLEAGVACKGLAAGIRDRCFLQFLL